MHRFAVCCLLAAVLAVPAGAGEVTVIDGDASFPEGPYWLDGKLFYVEYGGHTIDTWDGAASAGVLERGRLRPLRGDALRRRLPGHLL